jgi:voltage-gated potassium channel
MSTLAGVDERSAEVERRLNIPMLFVALLVVPILVIENSAVSHGWKMAAVIVNALVWLAFVAELVVMLRVVPDRKQWLRDHPLDVAIVLLTPPLVPPGMQSARVFRLLRLIRLMRMVQLTRRVFSLNGLRDAAVLTLAIVLVGGTAFAAVETTPGHNVTSWDVIWWAFQTVTTVGYGDMPVATTGGRVIGIAVMLSGIGFIAVLTAAMAQRFIVPAAQGIETEVADEQADIVGEIREISQRLRRLEDRLSREARRPR